MAGSISASVEQHGVNRYADVIQVQRLLNTAGAGLKDDGSCGTITIQVIKDYQNNFLPNPDGRVDPGGATWRHLLEGKLKVKREPLIILPQLSGQGYYPYAAIQRQYGTNKCVKTLLDVCSQFRRNLPTLEIGIGDISLQSGGPMSPHKTHHSCRDVDIRPLRKDGKHLPVDIHDANYSQENTKLLVSSLLAHYNVKSILFNDTHVRGVTYFAGHDNHLHVTMKE